MKISAIIEKNFWMFLIAGLLAGIWQPVKIDAPAWIPKILLEMMLLLVFLKTDFVSIVSSLKKIKLMAFTAFLYMLAIPLLLYFSVLPFSAELATGALLLTSMPSGASSPALTDIAGGDVPLAMSIALVTQTIAPFSIPLILIIAGIEGVEINKLMVLKDVALLMLIPAVLSVVAKKTVPAAIEKTKHFFTSINVFVLFAFVYIAISSQRELIINDPLSLVWKVLFMYMIFIFLHAAGLFVFYSKNRKERIAFAVTSAYMNNGLAIVLAASYFSPGILVLMVLSEIPWNTLPAPFKKLTEKLQHKK
jgi:BASS family bile acid:Na+ symporter